MYAGIDLGATNLRVVVADAAGDEVGRSHRETPQGSGDAITDAIVATLRAACADAGTDIGSLLAVGVGSIGPLDRDGGVVVDPPNVPADRIPVVAALSDVCDAPITMHNDATTAAAGEQRFADTPPNAVYLTISSGIGAGAVVDGSVLSGWRGNAAEVGHSVVEPGGRRCGCGGTGHWEAYCSGRALPVFARDIADRTDLDTDLDLDTLDAPSLFAAPDDPLAERVLDAAAARNAIGVANLVHAYAPEVLSVGGAVALGNPDRVLDPIRERLPGLLATPVPTLRITPLGGNAVLRGAVALALDLDATDPVSG